MKVSHEAVISEYNGNRKNTIGLNDLTIIALAKTLGLPVVSSEKETRVDQDSNKRQKIPDICKRKASPTSISTIFFVQKGSRISALAASP
jgi:hypothetical protein